jgi:hypothetical protein
MTVNGHDLKFDPAGERERLIANGVLAERGLPLITRESWTRFAHLAEAVRRLNRTHNNDER